MSSKPPVEVSCDADHEHTATGYLASTPVLTRLRGETSRQHAARVADWLFRLIYNDIKNGDQRDIALAFQISHVHSKLTINSHLYNTEAVMLAPLRDTKFYVDLQYFLQMYLQLIKRGVNCTPGSHLEKTRDSLKKLRLLPIRPPQLVDFTHSDQDIDKIKNAIGIEGCAVFIAPNADKNQLQPALAGYLDGQLKIIKDNSATEAGKHQMGIDFRYDHKEIIGVLQRARERGCRDRWSILKGSIINAILLAKPEERAQIAADYRIALDMHFNFPGIQFMRGQTDARKMADLLVSEVVTQNVSLS